MDNQEIKTDANAEKTSFKKFFWIEDEGLLRDEGVLFGLEGVAVEEKIETINNYYDQVILPSIVKKDSIELKKEEVIKKVELINDKIISLEVDITKKNEVKKELNFYWMARNILGATLVLTTVIANYKVIEFFLKPYFGQNILPAIGIFGFGMFNIFKPFSIWFLQDEQISFPTSKATKIDFITEILPPLVSTSLLIAFSFNFFPIHILLVGFFFVLTLFLLNGKLFLSLGAILNKNIQLSLAERKQNKINQNAIDKNIESVELLRTELVNAEKDKAVIENELTLISIKIKEVEENKKSRINLFLSEYKVGNTLKESLNNKR